MSSDFNINFVEDNFFSEDDWDSRNLLMNWSADSSVQSPNLYFQHENETSPMDFNVDDLLANVESPPLTPPDERIAVEDLLKDAFAPVTTMSCEDLFNDLSANDAANQNHSSVSPHFSLARNRSDSNESSSTSAYSSQSPTPPPPKQFGSELQENHFFSSDTIQNQTMRDEGFHDFLSSSATSQTHGTSRKTTAFKTKKPTQKLTTQGIVSDDDNEFDRKVAEALKETNRLLNMHKMAPCSSPPTCANSPSVVSSPPNNDNSTFDLRRLCDSTILNTEPVNAHKTGKKTSRKNARTTKIPTSSELTLKELKRKASGKPQTASSAIVTTVLPSNSTAYVSQTCQLPVVNAVQTPITCRIPPSQPPLKIIVKQEPVTQLLITTSANSHPVTFVRADGRNLVNTGSTTSAPSVGTSKEIPLRSLVIKPDKSRITVPLSSLNITPGQAGLGAAHDSTVVAPIASNGINLGNKSVNVSDNCTEMKPVCSKSNSKPLMVSQPAKKPIVPNGNTVYPSALLQNCMPISSPVAASRTLPDRASLNNLDVETQNRVLKRQQRMIKNRQWACQSRQRRKEYITMLEQRANACADENRKLREMNTKLRSRMAELEEENATLRTLVGASKAGQRKAACILMLVLFIGFNVNPMGFVNWSVSSDLNKQGLTFMSNGTKENWPTPVQSGFHGRQLLAVVDKEADDKIKQQSSSEEEDLKKVELKKLRRKQEYWMDDMVKDYKKQHISRILEILQVTSPVSLQRLLRRKLKEELGIRVPLPIARSRRIAYTPMPSTRRSSAPSHSDEHLVDLTMSSEEVKLPPPPPRVRDGKRTESSPCEPPERNFDQPNQTDIARVSDRLAKWIEQHEVQQRKGKQEPTSKSSSQRIRASKHKRKRRNSGSNNRNYNKSSIPVLYEKRGRNMERLLEAIDRKNDTVYMISFSKDHILLPAAVIDSSAHTKMSLVLPTAPPNDSFVGGKQAAMIQINCEVHSTNYVRVDRDVLAGVGYPNHNTAAEASNSKIHHLHQNPKRRAYHGSKNSAQADHHKNIQHQNLNQDDDATVSEDFDL